MDPRSVTLAVVFAAVAGCSGAAQVDRPAPDTHAQVAGTPDLTVQQAAKIPPIPPREVAVTAREGKRVVSWEPSPLESVIKYRIYRKSPAKPEYVKIAEVSAPPFSDANSTATAEYAVTSVNGYGAESALATPDKNPKRK